MENQNTYHKYCPNVFLAKCPEKHEKGETIDVTTKYGKENECIVFNLIFEREGFYYYSIIRADGYNNQERARNKVEKLNNWADNADKKGSDWQEKSNEGKEFLALAEPIKVGHHSEKRHRALIERNWNRMSNAMEEYKKADTYRERTAYWESMANKIDLSMPESLEFYEIQLEEAKVYHQGLKDGSIKREHSYSLTYAGKRLKIKARNCCETLVLIAGNVLFTNVYDKEYNYRNYSRQESKEYRANTRHV